MLTVVTGGNASKQALVTTCYHVTTESTYIYEKKKYIEFEKAFLVVTVVTESDTPCVNAGACRWQHGELATRQQGIAAARQPFFPPHVESQGHPERKEGGNSDVFMTSIHYDVITL